jgi:hypothetical protein
MRVRVSSQSNKSRRRVLTLIRDFMESDTRTGHTNMDVYDHVLADDLEAIGGGYGGVYFFIKYAVSPPTIIFIRVSLSSVAVPAPPSAILIVALSSPEVV